MFIGRYVLPRKNRALFLVLLVVLRLLMVAVELQVAGSPPRAWAAILSTLVVYAVLVLVARRLGWYDYADEDGAAAVD
ncbi:MAG: hypothetical protein ACXWLG_14905 [Myxococcaceae bacterium]